MGISKLGTEGNIDDYVRIQEEEPQRDALHEFGWLPTRHGALLKTLPVHDPNDLFDTTFRLFTLQSPLRTGKTNHAIELLSDDRFVNLGANLRHFLSKMTPYLCFAAGAGLSFVRKIEPAAKIVQDIMDGASRRLRW